MKKKTFIKMGILYLGGKNKHAGGLNSSWLLSIRLSLIPSLFGKGGKREKKIWKNKGNIILNLPQL